MFVKILFKKGVLFPKDPIAIQNGQNYYIINCQFCEVYDGKWLVKIDNKVSVKELTRMPMQRIRFSGVGMAFDCELRELEIIGRVVKKNEDY
ncbi:TPA: phage repressor protein CI [Proteus mirabilis]